MSNKFRRNILIICTLITGISFAIMFYVYTSHKQVSITKLNFSPYVFQVLNSNKTTPNHSISIESPNKKLGFNLGKMKFKLYYIKKQNIYILKYALNNSSNPLMTLYETPKYKYGLFDDKKSFWLVLSDSINKNRYNIFAFYSLYKPKPIKLYESDIDENFDNINIEFKNDLIKIIAPSGITKISKFGVVNSNSLK